MMDVHIERWVFIHVIANWFPLSVDADVCLDGPQPQCLSSHYRLSLAGYVVDCWCNVNEYSPLYKLKWLFHICTLWSVGALAITERASIKTKSRMNYCDLCLSTKFDLCSLLFMFCQSWGTEETLKRPPMSFSGTFSVKHQHVTITITAVPMGSWICVLTHSSF